MIRRVFSHHRVRSPSQFPPTTFFPCFTLTKMSIGAVVRQAANNSAKSSAGSRLRLRKAALTLVKHNDWVRSTTQGVVVDLSAWGDLHALSL